jgi:hypothetical protein
MNRFWFYNFKKSPYDLRSEMAFFARLRKKFSGKVIFCGNFYKQQKFIFDYFSYMIDFCWKPISNNLKAPES